ncbi:putative double-stranded binding protein [Operophtera brumata]|uniref:Putative double-stranded binding protein n=1 Tax=Operophtera brumata TaxID=104452 RepID=A0A0L7L5Q6_OPEBR|nr:putative double-stranded binding protein [Operophtera brumata]
MQYGVGRGSSKRQAKSQAARASIHILIPEMRDELPTGPADLKLCKDDPDFTVSTHGPGARASIHILIPEMRDELPTGPADLKLCKDDPDFTVSTHARLHTHPHPGDEGRAAHRPGRLETLQGRPRLEYTRNCAFFDYVTIEDPRIQEFCGAAAEPSPHAILRTCLLRNFGAGDRHIHTEEFCGAAAEPSPHAILRTCLLRNFGAGDRHIHTEEFCGAAAEPSPHAILRTCLLRNFGAGDRHIHTEQLHPHITSWGSLLRLYGSRSMKSCKEKKLEEQQITLLQDKARHNEPNHAVLEKLRDEMRRLKERDEAVVPIGTLLVSEGLPSHSGSNLNNVDL